MLHGNDIEVAISACQRKANGLLLRRGHEVKPVDRASRLSDRLVMPEKIINISINEKNCSWRLQTVGMAVFNALLWNNFSQVNVFTGWRAKIETNIPMINSGHRFGAKITDNWRRRVGNNVVNTKNNKVRKFVRAGFV